MRQLVRYDLDDSPGPSKLPESRGPATQPPSKKRKRNNHNHPRSQRNQHHPQPVQHWDDPGNPQDTMVYDELEEGETVQGALEAYDAHEEEYEEGEDEEEEGESRELSHQEIWDDSALIDAWNSAEAEYEAYHGKSKDWKADPVKRSPLWYNKPYTGPPSQSAAPESTTNTSKSMPTEPDTAPLDFNTFVPSHDPSLPIPSEPPQLNSFIPAPSTTMVSRDEAFNNALSAMYWSGYWTAVYHAQSQSSDRKVAAVPEGNDEDAEEGEYAAELEDDEVEQGLVPAQR
ncbi:hypothetical protein HYDPIDRAFT_32797 [Hydnomerulius pinastri MD-312]|uniref:Survival Motor Neuron Gemin2-binding domain-containing protein n=1 Tax=Hydnomerulius pinastri MD-312 TaxID=994086 RepID=A0A0C9V3B6_9AGAM|nr:hypothetical protein HYDPIDRAFT_32797 [Hydnomerulius pinastri MD-312]